MSYRKLIYIVIPILIVMMAFFMSRRDHKVLLNEVNVKDISDSSYKIFFDKAGRGVNEDGTLREIYSVVSDGTSFKFEKNETSGKWWEEFGQNGIFESMGHYYGDFQSPDGKKELVVKTGLFGTGIFAFFTTPELYVIKGDKKKLLWDRGFGEAQWFPDSKRVVFGSSDGGIVIINVEAGKYGYLTKEDGDMFKIEENSR